MKKVVIFGTRPEFIKLLPLIREINIRKKRKDYHFIFTGQQSEIIKEIIHQFNFRPDEEIKFKDHKNDLASSFSYLFHEINKRITDLNNKTGCTVIIAQGDTTTCVCASMVAFMSKIPFAHIEAGLRTGQLNNPWPEEYYRKIISVASTLHFTPTKQASLNLIREGVSKKNIFLTGNTVVDFIADNFHAPEKRGKEKIIVITIHRRENQESVVRKLILQILKLSEELQDYKIIWIKHPAIEKTGHYSLLAGKKNISVLSPLPVLELYQLLRRSSLVITDSGGLQEECPSFNLPALIIRENTERNESIDLKYAFLIKHVGNNFTSIVKKVLNSNYPQMKNPFGKGVAAKKILDILEDKFKH